MFERLAAAWLIPLPHHAISRLVFWLTRRQSRLTPAAIRWFAKRFNVDMDDAVEPDLAHYPTFNAFFTRALKDDARPICKGPTEIACPADGRISAIGSIKDGQIFQAKGIDYTLSDLLGDQGHNGTLTDLGRRMANGAFTTIYLSPRDYHRLHMPRSGTLTQQTYVPGRLFSVAPHTVNTRPGLFARNERVVAHFDTAEGAMALVLVGAINVAAIETVWHGLVTPPAGKRIQHWTYNDAEQAPVTLERGQEMGRFNMGSTIIVLMENSARWRVDMQPGDAVRMGQFLGHVGSATVDS